MKSKVKYNKKTLCYEFGGASWKAVDSLHNRVNLAREILRSSGIPLPERQIDTMNDLREIERYLKTYREHHKESLADDVEPF